MRTLTRVCVALFVTALITACGNGSPTSPSPSGTPLTRVVTTAHFEFRYSDGDTVDTAWQEAFHDWATRELQVTITAASSITSICRRRTCSPCTSGRAT
jgi:hypothetical protein